MPSEPFDPFGFMSYFKDEWLVSAQALKLFLVAIPFGLALTPVFLGWIGVTNATDLARLFWGVVGVIGTIGLLFLWLGMWRYWMRLDTSKPAIKRLSFVVLFLGIWYGSMIYYFWIYRPQVISRLTSGVGEKC